jgi:two-component system response regulator YesN
MYKLLVVDDEYNIRDGIVNAIPWHTCNAEVVGDAGSGIEALKKVEQFHPDIVITDIYMDDMDGLELAESLRQKYPSIKVIILSGYDEFEYAKKALQLKIFSYLLKPVLPEELMKVVREVIDEIQNEERLKKKIGMLEKEMKINRQMLRERILNDLVHGRIRRDNEFSERLLLAGINSDKGAYACLIFSMDGYYDLLETHGMEKVYKMLQCIQEITGSIFEKGFDTWSYIDNMGNIIAVLGGAAAGRSRNLSDVDTRIEKLKHVIKGTMDITLTVAVGGFYGDILEVPESYTEALKALDMRVWAGKDCVIYIDDAYSISGDRFIYPEDRENAILAAINEDDDIKIRSCVKAFFDFLRSRNYPKEHVRVALMELFAVIARKFMDNSVDIYKLYERNILDPYKALDRFDTIDEINNWLIKIISGCVCELRKNRSISVKSVINKARSYIEANYTSPDISLNSIAEHVYLNPAYFSKLYKKETGETYMEYLTSLRISRAKALLRDTNIRVSDIGAAVGYLNSQYFATFFKKVTGKTPIEYREGR